MHGRRVNSGCAVRRGFTLVEMLVSLAVLTLALSVVGMVFTYTTRTANQAAAYSRAQNFAQAFVNQLKTDLDYCEPSQTFLYIKGGTMPAAFNRDGLEAGTYYRVMIGALDNENPDAQLNSSAPDGYKDPRTDTIMFLSQRPTASLAPPMNKPNSAYSRGTTRFAPVLVAYGMAAHAEVDWSGSTPQIGTITPITTHYAGSVNRNRSALPVLEWVLARRATIMKPVYNGKMAFNNDDYERLRVCLPEQSGNYRMAGDVAEFDLDSFLAQCDVDPDGRWEPPGLSWPYDPYDSHHWPYHASSDWSQMCTLAEWLLHPKAANASNAYFAAVLDEVPVELSSNLGLRMLPSCAWFQVEFLMPEDPRNSVEYASNPYNTNGSTPWDVPLWMAVPDGVSYFFPRDTVANRAIVAEQVNVNGAPIGGSRLADFARVDGRASYQTAAEGAVSERRVRMWPYAVRITVRVFDPHGRLKEPIIRSVVHRFE